MRGLALTRPKASSMRNEAELDPFQMSGRRTFCCSQAAQMESSCSQAGVTIIAPNVNLSTVDLLESKPGCHAQKQGIMDPDWTSEAYTIRDCSNYQMCMSRKPSTPKVFCKPLQCHFESTIMYAIVSAKDKDRKISDHHSSIEAGKPEEHLFKDHIMVRFGTTFHDLPIWHAQLPGFGGDDFYREEVFSRHFLK